jgi:hypothetical protein
LSIFGLSRKANRHPLLEAWDRLNRRFARVTYRDHEAFFRALLDTEFHVPTMSPVEPSGEGQTSFVELESDRGPAFPVCLDQACLLRLFPDPPGSMVMLGAEVFHAAREMGYHALAVFGDRPDESELTFGWDTVEWLGAGLLPTYSRYHGDHAVLHVPGLVEACRAATTGVEGGEDAELIEGVATDGTSRAVLVMTGYGFYSQFESVTPEVWFGIRRGIESRLAESGHLIPVVSVPESFSEYGESTHEEFLNAGETGIRIGD